MWEEFLKLLAQGGAGAEGIAADLAMKASPDALLPQLAGANTMGLRGITPPGSPTSWESVINPPTSAVPMPAAPILDRPDIMPTLPGNNPVTIIPPSQTFPQPQDPFGPSVQPGSVPTNTYAATPVVEKMRPSVGLTPEQIMGMMKSTDSGHSAGMRAPAASGAPARPPGAAQWGIAAPAARPSLADLLYRRR